MRELRHLVRDLEQNLPQKIKESVCFVGVKLTTDADGKINKIIYDIKHSKLGIKKEEAADAVVDFNTAMEDLKIGNVDGIGIWLSKKLNLTVIDLDFHKEEDEKLFLALKKDLTRTYNDTYIEVSLSGKGLHVILEGAKPIDRKTSRVGGVVEVYSENKPIIITGDMISESNNIMQGGQALESFCKQFLPLESDKFEDEEESKKAILPPGNEIATDEEVLEIALRDKKFKMLWEGRWKEVEIYPSHSEADCAFCRKLSYYCNNNSVQMDRMFRSSGMYRNDKERREVYIADKIQNAVKLCTAVFDWKPFKAKQEAEKLRQQEQQEERQLQLEVVNTIKENGLRYVKIKEVTYVADDKGKLVKESVDTIHEGSFESNKLFRYYDSIRSTGISNDVLLNIVDTSISLWKLPEGEQGDSLRFSYYTSDFVMYNPLQEIWYGWNNKVWEVLTKEKLRGLYIQCINSLYCQFIIKCAEALSENEVFERKCAIEMEAIAIYEYIQKATTVIRVNNALTLAQSLKNKGYDELFKLRNVLTLKNGMFNFDTLQLEDFNKDYYQTVQSPIFYDESAKCTKWEDTLKKFIPSEVGRNYFQKVCGYICSGETGERAIFMLIGAGGNGKSTLINVISHILASLAGPIKVSTLLDKGTYTSGLSPELVALRDLRMGVVSENNRDSKFDEGLLKSLSGSTPITCRGLFKEPITFMPTIKLIFDSNYEPNFGNATIGLWDRIKLIPTTGRIEDNSPEKIKDFYKVIIDEEGSGVFNWIVEGYKKYKSEGLVLTAELLSAVEEYKNDSNSLKPFIDNCIKFNKNNTIAAGELFNIYKAWCEDNGRKNFIMKQITFTKELKKFFAGNNNVSTKELRAGFTGFVGIEPSGLGYLYSQKNTMPGYDWEKQKKAYYSNLLAPPDNVVGYYFDKDGKRIFTQDISKATHKINGEAFTDFDKELEEKIRQEKIASNF